MDGSEYFIRAVEEAAIIASLMAGSTVEIVCVADMSKIRSEFLHSRNREELQKKERPKANSTEKLFRLKM